MSKKRWVLVNAISMFHMKYVVEVEEDGEAVWACDTVTCDEAKEFTQKHLDEVILDWKEIPEEELIEMFRDQEPILGQWDDETIIRNQFTSLEYLEERKKGVDNPLE